MKAKFCVYTPSITTVGKVLIIPALLLSLLVICPASAQADTSANATIYNEVTVSYTSGTQSYTISDFVNVTVTTLAEAPTVTVDITAASVAAAGSVAYVYSLRSNSNGPDTYTLSTIDSADTNVSASTDTPSAGAIALWGGIVVGSGGGYIELPGGSLAASGLAGGNVIELTVAGATNRYTVGGITAGNPAATATAEVYDQLALTPQGSSPAVTAANVAVGTQAGQVGTITLTQTAGIPSVSGSDGTHVNNLTFTTTATGSGGTTVTYTTSAGDTNETTTTVTNPAITIEKAARNATSGGGFVTDGSTTARPGEVIEYQVTVTNPHATASVTVVSISDPLPDYTLFAAGQYGGNDVQIDSTLGGTPSSATATAAADADVAEVGGNVLTVNIGSGANNTTGGALGPGDSVVILFRVQVDNT